MGRRLAWNEFCGSFAPSLIDQWGAPDVAERLREDLIRRSTSFAESAPTVRTVLCAPFVEEVVGYDPVGAPAEVLAAVCLVVRCSILEEAHVSGALQDDGIRGLTSAAAAPLHEWLEDREHAPAGGPAGEFPGLDARWPRAWAALDALARSATGGRRSFHMPDAPAPPLPDESEYVDVTRDAEGRIISSALDVRFDAGAIRLLESSGPDSVLMVSSLSRLSRNMDKMLRMLEIVLSRGGSILTTNSLIRPGETFTRSGQLVRPDSRNPAIGWLNTRGLSGIHRKTMVEAARDLDFV